MQDTPHTPLDIAQWAWEFLRRNPEYQADYREFISTWRALEAVYGAAPQRDFQRWQRDPRATRPAFRGVEIVDVPFLGALAGCSARRSECRVAGHTNEEQRRNAPASASKNGILAVSASLSPDQITGAVCTSDDEDRQLIECWMGAKWGFYQFPQNPQLAAGELATPINWRPAPGFRFDRGANQASDTQLMFDLALPLPAQLEAAKQWLVSKQAALRRQGFAAPRTLANQAELWTKLLAVLDKHTGELLHEAQEMSQRGYREILHLLPTSPKST